jgi:hypothetical protein
MVTYNIIEFNVDIFRHIISYPDFMSQICPERFLRRDGLVALPTRLPKQSPAPPTRTSLRHWVLGRSPFSSTSFISLSCSASAQAVSSNCDPHLVLPPILLTRRKALPTSCLSRLPKAQVRRLPPAQLNSIPNVELPHQPLPLLAGREERDYIARPASYSPNSLR